MASTRRLQNKRVIVIGGGRDIGRAVALAFDKGADVLVNYRSKDAAAKQAMDWIQELGQTAVAVKADISNYQDARSMVDQAVQELGRVDILVNNVNSI